MTSTSIAETELVVFQTLQIYVDRGVALHLDASIIDDLKLISDDATQLALDLERKFNVRISRDRWRAVHTVRDLIAVVDAHRPK
jgi:acyl carrier protein